MNLLNALPAVAGNVVCARGCYGAFDKSDIFFDAGPMITRVRVERIRTSAIGELGEFSRGGWAARGWVPR